MLTSTFVHVQGIGYSTERRIWDMGVLTWQQFLEEHANLKLPEGKKSLILSSVEESVARLSERDHAFFGRTLAPRDHWRAISEFGDSLAFLDIETTGCYGHDEITVIGLYDGSDMSTFVKGRNMSEFPDAVSRYKMLVTFFGSGFDLPFIRRTFPDLKLDQLHVDLCFLLRRLGLTGGLKCIEATLGIRRRPECEGLDGFDAVRLWNEYTRGSEEALELLLLYNAEDVANMQPLLAHACCQMVNSLGHEDIQSLVLPCLQRIG